MNGTAYLSVEHNHLYAVALDDGSVQWNESPSGTYPNSTTDWISTPAVQEGRVYVSTIDASYNGTRGALSTVHALDAATGETDWRFDTAADVAAPSVANETVYLGAYHALVKESAASTGMGSGVYALDATSGAERWRYVIAGSAGWPIDDVLTLPVPAEGSLYVTEYVGELSVQAGTVHAVNSTTEAVDPRNQFADDSVDTVLNDPPTVSIAADPPNATEEPVPPGTNVTLTADAADADGNVTDIAWEIDGTVEQSGESLTLDIAACTAYDVTVRVTDDGGATTRERISIEGACEQDC